MYILRWLCWANAFRKLTHARHGNDNKTHRVVNLQLYILCDVSPLHLQHVFFRFISFSFAAECENVKYAHNQSLRLYHTNNANIHIDTYIAFFCCFARTAVCARTSNANNQEVK